MLELLYKGIVDHIREHMPEILWIDLYNEQYLTLQEQDPPIFPAIFIEWGTIPWTQLGQKCMEADTVITLHYCTENCASSRQSPDENMPPHPTDALAFLRGLAKIHEAFHGTLFSGEYLTTTMPITSAWMQLQNIQDTSHDGLRIERVPFKCRMYDYTSHPAWKQIGVENVKLKIIKA